MALGDGRRRRRLEAFVAPLLETDEHISVVIAQAQTGPNPRVRALFGAFGMLGTSVATIIFRLKTYGLVVTDRRLLIARKSSWTGALQRVEASVALDEPISAEFDDRGRFRELQLARVRGFDSGYLSVWVANRFADDLARFRTAVQTPLRT